MNFRRQSKEMRSNSANWSNQYGTAAAGGASISQMKSPNKQAGEKSVPPNQEPARLKETDDKMLVVEGGGAFNRKK